MFYYLCKAAINLQQNLIANGKLIRNQSSLDNTYSEMYVIIFNRLTENNYNNYYYKTTRITFM